MSITPLTVYLSETASAYISKSDQLGTAGSGGAISNKNTTINNTTGWIEATSQGSTSAAFFGSIGLPSGHGWLLDSTLLEGQNINVGNWTPTIQLSNSGSGTVVADVHVRAFVYDSASKTYTQIGVDMIYAGANIGTSPTTLAFSPTSFLEATFTAGQKLYIDIWLNIITPAAGTGPVLRTWAATSSGAGNSSVQIVTPGYLIATVPPPAIVAASGWNDTTSPFGAFYGIWQFQGSDSNLPSNAYASYNADPAKGALTNPLTLTGNSNAANPSIFGSVLAYTWAQLEQVEGSRNWTFIENDIQWWAAQGKQVQLRVITGATKKNDSLKHYGGTCYKATPQWVFDAGAQYVTVAGTGGANDGTIYPVYWDTTYLAKYTNFVNAFAAKYDGDPRIHSVVIGLGCFGEGIIDESGGTLAQQLAYWTPAGYTKAVWTTTYTSIMATYKAAFKSTPLTVACGTTYIDWDTTYNENTIIAVALSYNIWLQDNGMVNKQSYPQNIQHHSNPAWVVTPNLEEQLKSAVTESSTLAWDMQQNTQFGGLVAFIYAQDINNLTLENQATLAQYAAAVTKPHGSGLIGH